MSTSSTRGIANLDAIVDKLHLNSHVPVIIPVQSVGEP